jgi:iron uptake system component EfeO
VAASSTWHRLGVILALGLWAVALLTAPSVARAASETQTKLSTYEPDDALVAQLDAKAAAFKQQIAVADVQAIVDGVQRMVDALQKNDIAGARQAWIDARVFWERSEIFTGDLFPDFNNWLNDDAPDAETGFHAVEVKLFAQNAPPPIEEAEALLAKIQSYQRVFAQLQFKGQYLVASMASAAYQMGQSETAGGESNASGTSLNDLQHTVEGLERCWNFMYLDVIAVMKPELAKSITEQIAGLRAMLGVSSLDQMQPGVFETQATALAQSLADSAVVMGWKAPDFTEKGE